LFFKLPPGANVQDGKDFIEALLVYKIRDPRERIVI